VPAETVIFVVVDDVAFKKMITLIQSLGLTVVSELVTRWSSSNTTIAR